jgi:hypothetical protein
MMRKDLYMIALVSQDYKEKMEDQPVPQGYVYLYSSIFLSTIVRCQNELKTLWYGDIVTELKLFLFFHFPPKYLFIFHIYCSWSLNLSG